MGIRKKIVVLAVVGIGGGTALYSPIALGLTGSLPVIGHLAGDTPDSKREQVLNKLAGYEDKLLSGETEAEVPQVDPEHETASFKRASLAGPSDQILPVGDVPADSTLDSELASGGPEQQPLNPPSASSLGLSEDEPFHVEAVVQPADQGLEDRSAGSVRESNQDRLIAELIKYRYKIKALEQELQTARNNQQMVREDETLRGKPGELERESSQKIEELHREIVRLKHEAGYGEQLKNDLSAALSRIDELKGQLDGRNGDMNLARRSSAADEQEKLGLAKQNKELRAAIALKDTELKELKAQALDDSNDRDWLKKLQSELETAKSQAADLQKKNKELALGTEELEQSRLLLEKRNQDVSKLSAELTRVGSQGKQIDQLKIERDKLAARVGELEQDFKSKAKLQADLEAVIKREDVLAREKQEVEAKLAELSEQSGKAVEENSDLSRKIEELKTASAANNQKLTEAAIEARQCSESLNKKSQVTAKVPDLVKKLVETKNELMLREAELQSLGAPDTAAKGEPSAKGQQLAKNDSLLQAIDAAPQATSRAAAPVPARVAAPIPTPLTTDVMVVQISSDKANVRSGPGEEYATLMQLARGVQLTVETQEGEWYRVILPTGLRGYIRADVAAGTGRSVAKAAVSAQRPPAASAAVKSRPKVVGESPNALMVPFDSTPAPGGSSVDDEETRAFEQLKDELMSKSRPR